MKIIKSKLKSNLVKFFICFSVFAGLTLLSDGKTYSESIYLDKNINNATYEELTSIDGIGHKTATEIMTNTPIYSEKELIDLRYIDVKRLARIKEAGYTIK